jgi:hypothetical protein
MRNIIINAIRNRHFLTFTYKGIKRQVQPTAVGVSRAGNDVMRCYQTKGEHTTEGHDWNLCTLSGISDLSVSEERFTKTPEGYNPGDKGMIEIYAEL